MFLFLRGNYKTYVSEILSEIAKEIKISLT